MCLTSRLLFIAKCLFATSASKSHFSWLSRKMACSQQELSANVTAADLGRGDRIRQQSGSGCAGEWGPTGAQRSRVRHRFTEEAETRSEEFSVVAAEHSK